MRITAFGCWLRIRKPIKKFSKITNLKFKNFEKLQLFLKHFNDSEQPCNKDGYIDCSASGRVIALNLWQLELDGEVPKELGLLKSLEQIDFEDNRLSGTIPAELGQLHNLKSLSLRSSSSYSSSICA